MPKIKGLSPIQSAPHTFSIVEDGSGVEIARYCIHRHAQLLENAELSKDIIAAYEKYIKNIKMRFNR